DAGLERDAGGRGGLLEDHPELAAWEEVVLLAAVLTGLEVVGEVEDGQQLLAAPVGDLGEVSSLQVRHRADATGRAGDQPGRPLAFGRPGPTGPSPSHSPVQPQLLRRPAAT